MKRLITEQISQDANLELVANGIKNGEILTTAIRHWDCRILKDLSKYMTKPYNTKSHLLSPELFYPRDSDCIAALKILDIPEYFQSITAKEIHNFAQDLKKCRQIP